MNKKNNLYACQYVVTVDCNSYCEYCSFWRNDPEIEREISIEEHKKIVDNLYSAGVKYLDFTGGEPLLKEWLPELMKYAKDLGFFVTTTTNGILFPKYSNSLLNCCDEINFSLESTDSSIHNKIRGVKSFDLVKESLKIAQELGFKYKIICTSNNNYKNIVDLIAFAQKEKTKIYISPVFSYFDNEGESPESANLIMELLFEPYVFINLPIYQMIISRKEEEQYLPGCPALNKTIVISPYGTIYAPCHQHVAKEIKIVQSLKTLIDTNEFKNIRSEVNNFDFCKECLVNFHFSFSFSSKFNKFFFMEAISTGKNELEAKIGIDGLIIYKQQINKSYKKILELVSTSKTYKDNYKEIINVDEAEENLINNYLKTSNEFWNLALHPQYFLHNYFWKILDNGVPDEIKNQGFLFIIYLWILFINKYLKTEKRIEENELKEYSNFLLEYYNKISKFIPDGFNDELKEYLQNLNKSK